MISPMHILAHHEHWTQSTKTTDNVLVINESSPRQRNHVKESQGSLEQSNIAYKAWHTQNIQWSPSFLHQWVVHSCQQQGLFERIQEFFCFSWIGFFSQMLHSNSTLSYLFPRYLRALGAWLFRLAPEFCRFSMISAYTSAVNCRLGNGCFMAVTKSLKDSISHCWHPEQFLLGHNNVPRITSALWWCQAFQCRTWSSSMPLLD